MMSNNRQQQSPGGASSVPSTSSSSTGGTGNTNGSVGSNVVTSNLNGNNSGNVVPSRTLAAASEGVLSVPTLAAVPSSRGGFASLSRPSGSSGSRKKSLHQAPLYNGLLNSYEDKSNDFVCPICFEMIEEAHMTKCGHSFCEKPPELEDRNGAPRAVHMIMKSLNCQLATTGPTHHSLRGKTCYFCVLFQEMSGLYCPMMELECTVPNVEAPSPAPSSIIDPPDYSHPPGFGGTTQAKRQTWYNSTLASRRKRLTAHFEDLEQCYFSNKMSRITDEGRNLNQLDDFMECLSKFTRYNSVRPLATLSYASDLYNGSSIVSSIEFDRDCDYFAIAGVTKKIKVFEYGTVIQDAVDIHYPVNEMTCNSKISCISWSSYHKNLLASSDYEGTVILWDGFTGQRSKVYQEHEKRCWSVDFNLMDPKLLASGSDDAKVKLWSTNLDNSVASIEAKANVCCVKFSPTSRYHLAFGCADHCVHYYDLRNTKQPIMVFKGHRKAVSYAKFVNGEEIVSASTDSQLKLWNVNKPHCLRSFKGHINEKNFVGLASNGDYVACGSENNSLYLYYKGLSKTLLTFKFDTVKSVLDKDKKEDDTNEFVSAVCWRAMPDGESNVLIAANSQGTIKVLELV
ncbi:E3 ubiquitin-protein ligase COP1 [Etheostoma spectabile]|uniref:E3 ubiquitin-protein ligase COP1 n=1 Tax=Etheostoma spectabile TaxID=54343 RepID=UPI0013AF7296|nr:E3 ubiquitin-protein ligase COP1-like [Etheostoma spectabile]